MKISHSFIAFLLGSAVIWLGYSLANADISSAISLSAGQRLRVLADGCKLSIAKNTPTLVKIKCTAGQTSPQPTGGTDTMDSLLAAITLKPGQTKKIVGNQCFLSVVKKKGARVVIECTSVPSTLTPTPSPTRTLTPTVTPTPCATLTGVIASDRSLTGGCTYLVTGNVLVKDTAKLTVAPGVTVKFGGDYYIRVEGSIEAIGSESQPILFTKEHLYWTAIEVPPFNPKPQIFRYAIFENARVALLSQGSNTFIISDSIFRHNQTTMFLVTENGGSTSITKTTFVENTGYDQIVVGGQNVTFVGNTIHDNTINGGADSQILRIGCSTGEIANNTITHNTSGYLIWYVVSYTGNCIHDNIVTNNTVTSEYGSVVKVWKTFKNNNLQDNDAPYVLLTGDGDGDVDVTQNYWGTTNTSTIESMIYDYNDDFNLMRAVFEPFKTTPIRNP